MFGFVVEENSIPEAVIGALLRKLRPPAERNEFETLGCKVELPTILITLNLRCGLM
jgi:hypothetical protein